MLSSSRITSTYGFDICVTALQHSRFERKHSAFAPILHMIRFHYTRVLGIRGICVGGGTGKACLSVGAATGRGSLLQYHIHDQDLHNHNQTFHVDITALACAMVADAKGDVSAHSDANTSSTSRMNSGARFWSTSAPILCLNESFRFLHVVAHFEYPGDFFHVKHTP